MIQLFTQSRNFKGHNKADEARDEEKQNDHEQDSHSNFNMLGLVVELDDATSTTDVKKDEMGAMLEFILARAPYLAYVLRTSYIVLNMQKKMIEYPDMYAAYSESYS